jgi:hypothetical protein
VDAVVQVVAGVEVVRLLKGRLRAAVEVAQAAVAVVRHRKGLQAAVAVVRHRKGLQVEAVAARHRKGRQVEAAAVRHRKVAQADVAAVVRLQVDVAPRLRQHRASSAMACLSLRMDIALWPSSSKITS